MCNLEIPLLSCADSIPANRRRSIIIDIEMSLKRSGRKKSVRAGQNGQKDEKPEINSLDPLFDDPQQKVSLTALTQTKE